jgi:hypothetical protein
LEGLSDRKRGKNGGVLRELGRPKALVENRSIVAFSLRDTET